MLNDSLAPAKRALIFFGCMAALVGGLTFGAGWQVPTDRSSATVAQLRGRAPAGEPGYAAAERSERGEAAPRRGLPAVSKQAMAETGRPAILR
ncbi:hypothetical protein [Bosea minatitlanensis]|uniref:Uncharacterized protein n=1 Tax=Bosea minatitlanensis TaxID=128782 RepID=A0ABW0F4I9_9HYPH|nr:hypothetical protein [Bosea minatitlanensis]MCT4494670.1 hypothetical protein [Bosea minatitlanensis]